MKGSPHEKIKETIDGYNRLLNIVKKHQGSDGICSLSKKEISSIYGLSYTGTLKKLNFLLKYGLIEQDSGGFKSTDKNVIQHTPLALILKILLLVMERPDVYSSFKLQAEILGVLHEDVQSAWGYYGFFFGSKYPHTDEIQVLKEYGL